MKTKHALTAFLILYTFICAAQTPTYHWAAGIGSTSQDSGNDIVVDHNGNVYTVGNFSGTADFDPGSGVFNLTPFSISNDDAFISKLDADGNFLWVKQLGGPASTRGNGVTVDAAGNVYIVGDFEGTADFDPGAGTANLTPNGATDCYVCKLDANGNFVWVKQLQDFGTAIAVKDGQVYTTGYFAGTADFDPGAGTFNLTAGGTLDVFVHKMDTAGNFAWAVNMGGNGVMLSRGIAVDAAGNVHTIGDFNNTIDMDPGAGNSLHTPVDGFDAFVSKLDANGNFVWGKQLGGNMWDASHDVALDGSGNTYIVGSFQDTTDFDPGAGVLELVSEGGYDTYVAKLDAAGNFVWAHRFGNSFEDNGLDVTLDINDNVYFTGQFYDTVDFDPGGGTFELIANGTRDVFITKLDAAGNFTWAVNMGGSLSDYGAGIVVNTTGQVYATGTFSGTADFDPGAGVANLVSEGVADIFIHKLLQCTPSSSSISITACQQYTSPSGNYTWTISGTYMDTIPNSTGCDSVITINLAIYPASSHSTSANACDVYTSPSGNYQWTTSGTYTDTLSNAMGCDSIITINLTINTVDTSVTNNTPVLQANAAGAIYQWLDCDNGFMPIAGATAQSYTATANGNYAVAVTEFGCTDTSLCYNVFNVGVEEVILPRFNIFPNPTSGQVHITTNGPLPTNIRVWNSIGQEVAVRSKVLGNTITLSIEGKPGIYLITLQGEHYLQSLNMVKEE